MATDHILVKEDELFELIACRTILGAICKSNPMISETRGFKMAIHLTCRENGARDINDLVQMQMDHMRKNK